MHPSLTRQNPFRPHFPRPSKRTGGLGCRKDLPSQEFQQLIVRKWLENDQLLEFLPSLVDMSDKTITFKPRYKY
jgi:hypothetical protein